MPFHISRTAPAAGSRRLRPEPNENRRLARSRLMNRQLAPGRLMNRRLAPGRLISRVARSHQPDRASGRF
jgi:hypothetical protein